MDALNLSFISTPMMYQIKNIPFLRKVLWIDFAMGSLSGLIGTVLCEALVPILGLTCELILAISLITLLYAIGAFSLARMKDISVPFLRVLIYANWVWTLVSLGFIYFHFANASVLGQAFLILQIVVVGGLATIEGRQLVKVKGHFKYSDSEFLSLFIDCALDPAEFSHEAHLRLAWINVAEYGIEQAGEKIQSQLKKFVKSVGAEGKYNTTVTLAAMKVVHHFMLKSSSDNFKDFIAEFPQLGNNFKGLLDSHYSFDIFNSDNAKTSFLEPDLIPFE